MTNDMNNEDSYWGDLVPLEPSDEPEYEPEEPEVEYFKLSDGRPINATLMEKVKERIKATGVTPAEIQKLPEIFSCNSQEVRLALGQSEGKYKRLTKTDGLTSMITDVSLALLVRWYLEKPENWPVKYIQPPDLDYISQSIEEIGGKKDRFPVLVGRNTASFYRWRDPHSKPSAHVSMLLSTLEQNIRQDNDNAGSHQLNDYIALVNEEATLRGVDYVNATGWKDE